MRPAGGAPCLVPALTTCTLLLVLGQLSSAAVVTHTYTRVHNNVSIMLYSLCSECEQTRDPGFSTKIFYTVVRQERQQ